MRVRNKILFIAQGLGVLTSLLACAGFSSGPTSEPISGNGSAPLIGGQNGSGAAGHATGGSDFSGNGSGEGIPSTQQSDSGIGVGGRCVLSFIVTVKIIRDRLVQSCLDARDQTSRNRSLDFLLEGEAVMAPPENPVAGPKVVFFFKKPADHQERLVKVGTQCGSDGIWRTSRGALGFLFDSDDSNCGDFSARASASWQVEDSALFSNEFTGPPVPAPDAALGGVPVPLTIDLGPENLYNDDSQTVMGF